MDFIPLKIIITELLIYTDELLVNPKTVKSSIFEKSLVRAIYRKQ
ncbi:hypothetical protein SAMN05443667_104276 [Flavobacterium gillisiae]|uniref:Uncharacterized protein n=1 Tax=Flavobacterium gillisiae TaxID=150146 RepID=A0A1H4BBR3_9FLAO|nr:hypothetical protein SAMN05443667_104276 [Flavobacterium gillisiae]